MTPKQQRIKAAELMGYAMIGTMDCGLGEQLTAMIHPGQNQMDCVAVPAYDTDANAALELCEALYAKGFVFDLSRRSLRFVCLFMSGPVHFYQSANTPVLAILGAFLRCHGIDPEAESAAKLP